PVRDVDGAARVPVGRSTVLDIGGWSAEVLFENLELWRAVEAAGHTALSVPHVRVAREAPSVRQFWSQRVRQAYDDLAQPGRLVVELAILPVAALAARRGPEALGSFGAACVLVAVHGRRRLGTERVPPSVPLWAPVWVLERGVCTWLALACRLRGGVRYHGSRVRVAAHSAAWLRRSQQARLRAARGEANRRTYPVPPPSDQAVDGRLSAIPVGTSTA
ncbi:MAG: hypothetical protein HOU01_25885, partial [Streptomycetaceae bacterium]|nr:hypothetical protein [Streptomycetaceae bacterium]